MKLHLPTALRRALLAITALLSPAVVTTTLATATLAAISAPAMAADLSLTGSHKLSSDKSYDSVYTNASSVTLKASGDKLDKRKLTTGTLTVNYGDTLNLTTDEMVTFYLNVGRLTVGENATININTGDKGSIYASAIEAGTATGTLYDLLSGVRNAGIVIEKAHTIYFEGAGSDNLTTSFITSKIGGTPAYNGICGIEVTEGHLTVDSSLAKSGNLSYQLRIGSEAAATTTITKDVNHLESAFFVGSAYHTECTTVSIEYSANALTLEDIYLYASSKIVSDRDLIFQNESTVYLCGELTVNGKTTFAGDTYITNTNYSTACTMSTNGSTAVNSGVTVDIQTGTKWNIGGIIENNGTLNFNGSCTMNIASSGFQAEYSYSLGNNGYKVASIYTVHTGTGTITGIANCTWLVDSATASYANGKVTVSGLDTSVFYVKNGEVKYGTVVPPLATPSTKFSLEGGRLELGRELGVHQGIIAKTAGSSVEIVRGTELKSNQVTVEGSGSVVLSGGGSYTMANGTNTLGTGVSVGSGWSGTVNTTGNTTALALDKLGVNGSNVVLGSNNHTLAARNQSVAANITSTGSISLTDYKLTLSGTNNKLGSVSVGSLEITGGSTTITDGLTTGSLVSTNGGSISIANGLTTDSISGTVSVTGGTLQEMTAGSAISTSGSVSLSNVTLGAVLNNSGTLNLGGTINVDSTALTSGTRERYSAGDNGYKTIDTTYTVLTGAAATGSATWKVGSDSATYEDGMVIVAGIENKSVYYVKNGVVKYDTGAENLKTLSTKFSLEGGSLELGKELVDDQGIVAKTADSSVTILSGTELKSNQVTVEGSGSVVLSGGGSYTMTDDSNTLGTGVSVGSGWSGSVKTTEDTTALELDKLGVSGSNVVLGSNNHTLADRDQSVAANLNSTGKLYLRNNKLTLSGTNNTLDSLTVGSLEIAGGSTTISKGLTTGGAITNNGELNLSGTNRLNGAITNNGELNLSGNSTLGCKITNNGTLVLAGTITLDTTTFKPDDAVEEVTGYFIGNATKPNSTQSGFKAACWDITIAEGGSITDNRVTWQLAGDADADFDFVETDGTLHAYGSSVESVFHVAMGDTITYSKSNAKDFENRKETEATAISLNGGKLVLNTDLRNTADDYVKSTADSAIEIGNGVTLNAAQLDASAAKVTLSGGGSYTLADGANTLGAGVSVGSGWSGTVNTIGDTTALELNTLGVSGSNVVLGSNSHTLEARNQEVAANLNSSGSISLTGNKLTLSGTNNKLGSLNVGSLEIAGGSTAISNGLTTGGAITNNGELKLSGTNRLNGAITNNGELNLSGNSTLGCKITNNGTLVLAGTITLDTTTFKPDDAVEEVTGYFIGNATKPNSTQSGFKAACWDITIAEGGSITDNRATWQLAGDADADFDFVETDGTLHAYGSSVESVFHVAMGDTITYSKSNAKDFENRKETEATAISLNGGKLVLNTDLRNTADDYVKSTADSAIEIGNGVTLNAAQLDTSAADVTLSGSGSYDMQGQELDGAVKLDNGVKLDANEWKGTVYTGGVAQGAALDIRALGKSQSTVHLGARPMLRATPSETELESLNAAGVGTTVIPGSLTLQNGSSKADTLVVNGTLTLGSTNTAASLEADTVSLQRLNFAHADSSLKADKLNLEGSTTLNVQLPDEVLSNKDAGETLTLLTLANEFDGTLTFNDDTETERVRSGDNRKEYTLAWDETGTVLTLTILGTETYVTEQVAPTTGNGSAGVALMTEVFLNSRPQKEAPEGALAGILNAVDAGAATDRDMAAVAGASTAALGMALSGDVERQLSAIRNRSVAGNDAGTVTLASGKSGMLAAAPARFFAWVNAEGNRAEQDADSTAAGYTLTSWGGTLGAGMQVNDKLTLGLALTAMYGDLQSDGPDYLKGDMDTTYVSAFARYNKGKWSHAFIGTVGSMEADYKRSAMSYSTAGDTDGTALGLMYEVSRGVQLSNRSTLSPVLNIAYRHTEVDSYSESGADAALNVGKQSLDTVTAGAGARYAAVVGQRMLNRACGFEARALVKYDLGDRQSTTSTGFINRATRAGIESAELGAFGVELGAGISVPVRTGSIFADAAVELRSDYTNMNGTVGYRMQF